jgi:Na+(H+)/acetate symporter ActP
MSFIIYVALIAILAFRMRNIMFSFNNGKFSIRTFDDPNEHVILCIMSMIINIMTYSFLGSIIGSTFILIVAYVIMLMSMFHVRGLLIPMLANTNDELNELGWLQVTKVDDNIAFEENIKNRDILDTAYYSLVAWPMALIVFVYTKIQHKL